MGKKRLPRGIRNNNPLNIRKGKWEWLGEIHSKEEKSFCVFRDMKYGYRAAFLLMFVVYYEKRGLKTIREIINRWAPPSENRTQLYVSFVARRVDFDERATLPLPYVNVDIWLALLKAMTIFECGYFEDAWGDSLRIGVLMCLPPVCAYLVGKHKNLSDV